MGPHRAKALSIALAALAVPCAAQEAGWHYSFLPGEGDRASMGCDREATPDRYTCLAVRCEADFTTGIHVHSSRPEGDVGPWEMTVDREAQTLTAEISDAPYGGRFVEDADWLLDRVRHGTFVYLKRADDPEAPFAYIDLSGSFTAIEEALFWCAPRVPPAEQIGVPGVEQDNANGDEQ
jgi:hypothetical protein